MPGWAFQIFNFFFIGEPFARTVKQAVSNQNLNLALAQNILLFILGVSEHLLSGGTTLTHTLS